MELLNERNQVRTVAKRWRAVYGNGTYGADKRGRSVGAELEALDAERATAADVAEIVGNKSWVSKNACDECGVETWDAVQVGEEPDYESSTAVLCRKCIKAALALLGGGR